MAETYLPAPHAAAVDFDSIRLRLASPEVIMSWSHGEVSKPETINYRTQKPEKDGLFDERIFGPTKDWECYCGKYKKVRYKGIVCDKCGVEVTHSLVRRSRMGHIDLAAPVTHIWFLRGVPSKIGLALDLSVMNLEKVIYFVNFIITKVDESAKNLVAEEVKSEFKGKKKQIENEFKREVEKLAEKAAEKKNEAVTKTNEYKKAEEMMENKIAELEADFKQVEKDLKDLKMLKIIPETTYLEWSLKYGHIFEAGIGAEAIFDLLKAIDVKVTVKELGELVEKASGAKRERIIRRMKLLRSLDQNGIKPEWMILSVIPVIPPDLRPMVPLDGGRFATSDLNDLYRRVINRNNRLKRLRDLNAPEVISRNEKRMLQEAVDALLDNSARQSKTAVATTGKKRQLRSLADILKGKQGRFRQNLLGKRTDYSGRSVIVVGPSLDLHQCGIPKKMALELFRPFVISKLIKGGVVHNIRSANRYIEGDHEEVWDILEEVTKESLVLLNRAPTLHRLGIQAFQPILIEGKAIRIHPMVCTAFNADFDGDQMAVHVPLTEEAKKEARELMLSAKNLLKPATGAPVTSPNKDVAWGVYYITTIIDGPDDRKKSFANETDAKFAYDLRKISIQEKIILGRKGNAKPIETNVGRILFNRLVPENIPYQNDRMDTKKLNELVRLCLELNGQERTARFLDELKNLGFSYVTRSGFSWGMMDLPDISEMKGEVIKDGDARVAEIESQYQEGLLTITERHNKIIGVWTEVKDSIQKFSKENLDTAGSVFTMMDSGARGSPGQLTQMVGMKGLVSNPAGDIIELPVKAGFKEGFDVLEYFISTHGTRKGLSDTALRTANAGYLTRRLVDVAQDIVIRETDCKDTEGLLITAQESEEMGVTVLQRITGRYAADTIKDAKGKKLLVKKGQLITYEVVRDLAKADIAEARVRSILRCKLIKGFCQKCYGFDLAFNKPVEKGVAVGIVAAQSIGEPGTQLTMRTFHTGGVAGQDITQGLPRVEELFEARPPKRKAIMTDVTGKVAIEDAANRTTQTPDGKEVPQLSPGHKIVRVSYQGVEENKYKKTKTVKFLVEDGGTVQDGQLLFQKKGGDEIHALKGGVVRIEGDTAFVVSEGIMVKEFIVPPGFILLVRDGDLVGAGDALTEGNLDLQQLFRGKGREAVEEYILREIQTIYTSQGQKLNDKHIEVIIRQMFSRMYVKDAGETDLLPGEIVEVAEYTIENEKAKNEKKKLAEGDLLFLGISKIALSTHSFLSAASFQETAKVLINAAVTGKIDPLEGLKENVIIGRLIPAGTGFMKQEEEAKKKLEESKEKEKEDKEKTKEKKEKSESKEKKAEEEKATA